MSSTQTLTQRKESSRSIELKQKQQFSSSSIDSLPPVYAGYGVSPTGEKLPPRVPSLKPSFTVGDLRKAIPAHCFTRPLSKSFGYLFGDLFLVAVIFYASTFIEIVASDEQFGPIAAPILRHVLWIAYWICQGCVMTGLWVIGHECGHRGFADSEFINDAVGLIVHSCLLVPYFAWQFSHKRHHSNNVSIEHDEVFVPAVASAEIQQKRAAIKANREPVAEKQEHHDDHHDDMSSAGQMIESVKRMFWITIMLTLGWPFYLLANVTGNQSYLPGRWVNHFTPNSPIFEPNQGHLILIGDVALLAVFAVLYKAITLTSLSYVIYIFGIPYLIVNFWLVLITFLQHTDPSIPHYTDNQWDWLRGALGTVDRDYGFINIVLHHICDTHVVHHLFSTMPHYHAEEATKAVIPLLGDYYRFDSTPIFTALWRSFGECELLFPDEKQTGVHWFEKNKY